MLFSKKLKKYHGLSHCFYNRTGGQSKGIFKSLNCGEGSLDNKQKKKKNIKLACNKLNNSYKKLILLNQIHSNKFHYIKNISSLKKKKINRRCIDYKTTQNNFRHSLSRLCSGNYLGQKVKNNFSYSCWMERCI